MASIWGEKTLGYLSLDIICSSKLTSFLELRSRKTVRFSEQIMSSVKCPSIFRAKWRLLFIYSTSHCYFLGVHTSLWVSQYTKKLHWSTQSMHCKMGRLCVIPSSIQGFSCILIGCSFYGVVCKQE